MCRRIAGDLVFSLEVKVLYRYGLVQICSDKSFQKATNLYASYLSFYRWLQNKTKNYEEESQIANEQWDDTTTWIHSASHSL